jgi:hypothetical protein
MAEATLPDDVAVEHTVDIGTAQTEGEFTGIVLNGGVVLGVGSRENGSLIAVTC